MPYTAEKSPLPESSDDLRARIPGWGVDIDRRDRPSDPRERIAPAVDARSDFPERQKEKMPRERSIEHETLPPVFGSTFPPKGLSGLVRRYAYCSFSEGRAAHWLLLLAADRLDVAESRVQATLGLRPDNPFTETGIRSEFTQHGASSRLGRGRADLKHLPLDPPIVAASLPWLAAWLMQSSGRVAGTIDINPIRRTFERLVTFTRRAVGGNSVAERRRLWCYGDRCPRVVDGQMSPGGEVQVVTRPGTHLRHAGAATGRSLRRGPPPSLPAGCGRCRPG